MMQKIRAFLRREEGAVTVDWVALTAGVALFGMAIAYLIIDGGIDPLAGALNTQLTTAGGNISAPVPTAADAALIGNGQAD